MGILIHSIITNYDYNNMTKKYRALMILDAIVEGVVIGLFIVWSCGL